MKKIVALALCLIMALSLATVAFAVTGDTLTEGFYVDDVKDVTATVTYVKAKADTKTVAHYVVTGFGTNGGDYVVVAAADADAYYYNGVSVIYLAKSLVTYDGEGKAYTNVGSACGQITMVTSKQTAYTADLDADGEVEYYVSGSLTNYTKKLLVDGAVVPVNPAPAAVAHTWKAASYDTDGLTIATIKCSKCGATAKAITAAEAALLGKDAFKEGAVWYTLTSAGTTTGVTSAKTFDAGVALYAGMALMSVAGSAVVIGKKKEF